MTLKAEDILIQKFDGKKLTVFDIGAKGKPFSLPKLSNYERLIGFEPNPVEFEKLQSTESNNTTYYPFALSGKEEQKEINITRHASYSSFLEFDENNFKKHFHMMKGYDMWSKGMQREKTISVQGKNLDKLIKDENIDFVDFIKLDTQGTELEILKGGIQLIKEKKIGVIFSEVSFVGSYKEQNLFSDLDLFLRDHAYDFVDCRFYPESAYDIRSPFSKNIYDRVRYSVGGDAVFVPNIDAYDLDKLTLFKIGAVLASLGYFGIADNFLEKAMLSQKERQTLFRYFDTFSLMSILKNWTPPALLYLLKRFVR